MFHIGILFKIALRYLLEQSSKKELLSIMTLMSFIGVFLGTMVPLMVSSVMGGFQKEIKERLLSINGEIFIYPLYAPYIDLNEMKESLQELREQSWIESAEGIFETQGLFVIDNKHEPVLIRGVSQDYYENSSSAKKTLSIIDGERDIHRPYYIQIGLEMQRNYFITIGERLKLIVLKKEVGREPTPIDFSTKVTGVFKSGYLEYDRSVIYTSMETLQLKLGAENKGTKIILRLKDHWNMEKMIENVYDIVGREYVIFSWQDENQNLFRALSLEKMIMWLIMIIVLVISIFNVMSSQSMLVISKKKDIGILKTLGYTPTMILWIFLIEGLMISLVSGGLGLGVGSIILLNLEWVLTQIELVVGWIYSLFYLGLSVFMEVSPKDFILIPKDIYYVEGIPVDLSFQKIMMVYSMIFILSFISGLIPALRASREKVSHIIKEEGS